jgi:ribonuclease Z
VQITFLGTGAAIPTVQRAASAIAVRRKNEVILFDCGEATQRQMVQAGVGFHRTTKIFVTHMHGDHVLGLPGLLQTMSLLARKKELRIYGPKGIKDFIDAINQTVPYTRTFTLEIFEVAAGLVCDEKEYKVTAVDSGHMDPALCYALTEKARPGRFNTKKAQELGVPKGPLWSELQSGKPVTLPDGKVVKPEMVVGASRLGRKIVYTGDTGPSKALVKLAKNADLLIHESTFEDSLRERAEKDRHSTPTMAAQTAKQANVKQLVLTHISARYKDANQLLEQAKTTFPNTILAEDLMKLELPLKN